MEPSPEFPIMIPTPPDDCILVLTIRNGRICGWTSPDHTDGARYQEGVSFVFLSQDDIDSFIPKHSECCRDHDEDEQMDDDDDVLGEELLREILPSCQCGRGDLDTDATHHSDTCPMGSRGSNANDG